MLNTIATFALGALMAAFAIYAVLLNEGAHAQRRRRKGGGTRRPSEEGPLQTLDMSGAPPVRGGGRRLPVGDFLFGALYLRGGEPFPFADLAGAAADSGLDINQTLAWLARAEESGLIERIEEPGGANAAAQPAVRLTHAGMDVARNNRRSTSVRSSS